MPSTTCCSFTLSLVLVFLSAVSLSSSSTFVGPEELDGYISKKDTANMMKHFGIPNEALCHGNPNEKSDSMYPKGLSYGDVLMEMESEGTSDVQDDVGAAPTGKKKESGKKHKKPKKWPKGVVPYYISKGFNAKQKKKIEKYINDMNSKIKNVHFRRYNESDKNYVMIFDGKGCYSSIGMKGGQQATSLQSSKCLSEGHVQHEMMHVLGFIHEQNRPDRDNYIQVLEKNIPENYKKDYKKMSPDECNHIGKYDFFSVMHYPPKAPGDTGVEGDKDAFKILDKNVNPKNVGLQKKLSELDIQKAKELYSDK